MPARCPISPAGGASPAFAGDGAALRGGDAGVGRDGRHECELELMLSLGAETIESRVLGLPVN